MSKLFAVNCTWGSWGDWTSCSVTCGCFERARSIDVPAAHGGTNCNGDYTETTGVIMLTGGVLAEPQFISINPSIPLPAILNGTKNSITPGRDKFLYPAMTETSGN